VWIPLELINPDRIGWIEQHFFIPEMRVVVQFLVVRELSERRACQFL
jgi:hypothetical protein